MLRQFLSIIGSVLILGFAEPSQALQISLKQSKYIPKKSISSPLKKQFLKNARAEKVKPQYFRETLKEVENISQSEIDFTGLDDLSSLAFVTIDNDHSKDLDQAMFIDRNDQNGHYSLYYAIADASYFVRPGTSLDKEAAKRSFTTYMPGSDIPILPRQLSEGLSSLNAEVKRRAVVIKLELDEQAKVLSKNFFHAFIKSSAQLSYRGVQEYYTEGAEHPYHSAIFRGTLDHLASLGEALMIDAKKRGVVAFPEGELQVIEHADNYEIGIYERFRVEMFNEQISVIANGAVAEFLMEKGLKSIHRFHPSIPEDTLNDVRVKLGYFGRPWPNSESVKEYMDSLGAEDPVDLIAQINVCRANLKAKYDAASRGHYGLKVENYDHFTAPMRRYTDIIVHRILVAAIHGDDIPYQNDRAETEKYLSKKYLKSYSVLANHAREREQRIERANFDHLAALVLKPSMDKEISGTIVYLKEEGFAVKLDDFPFETWVRTKSMPDTNFELEKCGYQLRSTQNTFVLGQHLNFKIMGTSKNGGLKFDLIPVITE